MGRKSTKNNTDERENIKKNNTPMARIQTFQAVNENENSNKDDWRSPPNKGDTQESHHSGGPTSHDAGPQAEPESDNGDGTIDAFETDAEDDSEGSVEIEIADDDYEELEVIDSDQEQQEEYGYEEEIEEEEEEQEVLETSPEREVTIVKNSKSAARNKRRRRQKRVARDQENKYVTERIDSTHPNMRRAREASKNSRRRPNTPAADHSVDDEEDDQDTNPPKNRKQNRRQ